MKTVDDVDVVVRRCISHPDAAPATDYDIAVCQISAPVLRPIQLSALDVLPGNTLEVASAVVGRGGCGSKRTCVDSRRGEVMQVGTSLSVRLPAGMGCPGESGSPAFIKRHGQWHAAAILSSRSRRERDCRREGIVHFIALNEVRRWIFSTMNEI